MEQHILESFVMPERISEFAACLVRIALGYDIKDSASLIWNELQSLLVMSTVSSANGCC